VERLEKDVARYQNELQIKNQGMAEHDFGLDSNLAFSPLYDAQAE